MSILLTGAGAGISAGLLMKLLRLVQHISFQYQTGDFLQGVEDVSGSRRVLVLMVAAGLVGIVLYALRRIGNGGGDLDGAIWFKQGEMPLFPTLVSALLSISIVGMGVALGREGALKQAGGLIGNKVSAWFKFSPAQRQMLVACGAGAGMAAAYNVPLGGALFTMEVLLGSLSIETALPALASSFTAVAVSWTMLPNQPTYNFPRVESTTAVLAWAVVAAPILGLLSVAYVRTIAWAAKHKPKEIGMLLLPLPVFAALGLASVRFPELLGNGKNVVQLALTNQMAPALLCWLLVLRPAATILCLRTGAPGGLFTPTMTLGSLAGAVLGQGWGYLFPGPDKGIYAALGAGALIAAAAQGPISSIVFLLELTPNAETLLVPLLIAVTGATAVARRIETGSIYSARV